MTTTQNAINRKAVEFKGLSTVVIGSFLLISSLLGPSWIQMPANPAAGTPAASLSFQDLSTATASSPSSIQSGYFGPLAWILFAGLVVLSFATYISGNRIIAIVTAIIGFIVLVVTLLALKGPSTWAQFIDTVPNIRLGGYLMLVGLLTLVAYAVFKFTIHQPQISTAIDSSDHMN